MNKLKILVVDDEQIVLDSIKRILKKDENYEIETSLTASDGIEKIRTFQPEIVLTDLMMPEMDGMEFLKKAKEIDPNIIVIMITGYATINTALQSMQLGAFDYISKPFTRDELRKIIERASLFISEQSSKEGAELPLKKDLMSNIRGVWQHSWMMMNDEGLVVLGVERAILYTFGKIQNVFLPSVGDVVRQGGVYFQMFSSDLRNQAIFAPISGVVVEVNEKVLQNPQIIAEDPYGDGWLVKIRPDNYENDLKTLGLL